MISKSRDLIEKFSKPRIKSFAIIHAVLYQDNVRVHYTIDGWQNASCKIDLALLTNHVLEVHNSTADVNDITAYYFIEENLNDCCKSYLLAGKEIVAL